jgi:transcriptional regulator with XRE-family HTH domain
MEEIKMFTLPTIDTVGTGIRIMDLRKKAGLPVKDLQMMLGFATPNAIYKWQNGAAMPTLDNLIVLAAIFNVPIDDIIVIDNKTNMQIGA